MAVYEKKEYVESDAVRQAKANLEAQQAMRPGAYQSQWQQGLNDIMNKIQNREKFSYDLNGDALYQQYKDRYIQQGQQAMMDTMGQAAALTGGYGNSYAQTVGQQTYQGYLQGLNDKVPELYQLALGKYQMEGDELMNKYGLMADQEQRDYGRYRDSVADYRDELARLQGVYESERGFDYGRYSDDRNFGYGQYVDDRNYEYQLGRDQIADQQWQAAFDYQQERDRLADEQWQKEFDEAKRQYDLAAAKSSGGGGGGGGYVPVPSDPGDPEEPDDTVKLSMSDIRAELNGMIAKGAKKSDINSYLSSAKRDGIINQSQYATLKNEFTPRGSTY